MTDKMPEIAWLENVLGFDHETQGTFGSWDSQNRNDYVHPYVCRDIHDAVVAERDALKAELEKVSEAMVMLAIGHMSPAQLDDFLISETPNE